MTIADSLGAFTAFDAVAPRPCPGSPIDGLTLAVKANIAVAGLPWTAGIAAYRDRIAPRDAACVGRLRDAGAVVIGTTNMDEGAFGAVTDNPAFGRTQNPWRLGTTAGGSSGGSAAAVATGLCDAALGTDTFGSVRIPAAYCGLFGLKPARGAIPLEGVVPLAWTFDHVGILARDAQICRNILAVIGDEAAPVTGQTRALTSGLPGSFDPIELAGYDHPALIRHALLIAEAEASVVHADALADDPDGFSPGFRKLLDWGARQPAVKLAAAYRAIDLARAGIETALRGVCALILPSVPGPAHRFDEAAAGDPSRFTLLASILGWPAVVFPTGLDPEGLPLSAQVMARSSIQALDLAERLAVTIGPPPGFAS